MIITNGTIKYVTVTGGGLDATTGHPVAGTKTYGNPIPCQFYTYKYNAVSKSNGEHCTQVGYTILVEFNKETKTDRIALYNSTNNLVGEFPVISSEPLDAVCQEKITV